jgi:hypothetical protein
MAELAPPVRMPVGRHSGERTHRDRAPTRPGRSEVGAGNQAAQSALRTQPLANSQESDHEESGIRPGEVSSSTASKPRVAPMSPRGPVSRVARRAVLREDRAHPEEEDESGVAPGRAPQVRQERRTSIEAPTGPADPRELTRLAVTGAPVEVAKVREPTGEVREATPASVKALKEDRAELDRRATPLTPPGGADRPVQEGEPASASRTAQTPPESTSSPQEAQPGTAGEGGPTGKPSAEPGTDRRSGPAGRESESDKGADKTAGAEEAVQETGVAEEPAEDVRALESGAEAAEGKGEPKLEGSAGDRALVPVAAKYAGLVNANAAVTSSQVRGRAAARRAGIAAFFAARRGQLGGVVTGALTAVLGTVTGAGQRVAGWLMGRVLAVQNAVIAGVARVMQVVTMVASAVQQVASAVVSAVTGIVGGAVDRIMQIAESLPIPDLPLVGRVRSVVLRAARRIASVVMAVVGNVASFVNSVVAHVVNGVIGLAGEVGAALMGVVARVVAGIMRVIGSITSHLAALARRIRAGLATARARLTAMLGVAERVAVAQIDLAEREALQEIESNRREGLEAISAVLDFIYDGGDYPQEDGTWSPLDLVDSAVTKEASDAGAVAAFAAVAEGVRLQNALALSQFEARTSNIFAMVIRSVLDFLASVVAQIRSVVRLVVSGVAAVASAVLQFFTNLIKALVVAVGSMVRRVLSFIERVVSVVSYILGNPLNALRDVLNNVLSLVRTFVNGLIDRLLSFFRSNSGSSDADTSGVTSVLDDFTPSRLAAVARMASPPAAIGVLIAAAAAATAEAILVILMWIAIIGIALLLLYLLYLLVVYIIARVRAIPKTKARPRVRTRRRRRRRVRKPFFWNPRIRQGAVVASGGVVGVLDIRVFDPSRPFADGHHVWPKFVGGPVIQPLMAVRSPVHTVLHREFPLVIAPAAAAMGFTLMPTRLGNLPLITHLRGNARDRAAFTAAILGFYAAFNVQVDPPVPAVAFTTGVVFSAARL